jgi:hypothetical protein
MNMTDPITIVVDARRYEDYDDSLLAAADHVRSALRIRGWDVDARWDDDLSHEFILLTIPAWSAAPSRLADCGATVMPNARDEFANEG